MKTILQQQMLNYCQDKYLCSVRLVKSLLLNEFIAPVVRTKLYAHCQERNNFTNLQKIGSLHLTNFVSQVLVDFRLRKIPLTEYTEFLDRCQVQPRLANYTNVPRKHAKVIKSTKSTKQIQKKFHKEPKSTKCTQTYPKVFQSIQKYPKLPKKNLGVNMRNAIH